MLRVGLQNGVRSRAACPRRLENRPAVDDVPRFADLPRQQAVRLRGGRLPRHPAERGGGGVLLPAADAAAAAGTAIHRNDHMPELTGAALHTEMDFPADADAAADARADRDQQEVVRLPTGARINLAVKGAVGVVAQICGDAQPAGKRLRQRIIGQRQVGRADKRRRAPRPPFPACRCRRPRQRRAQAAAGRRPSAHPEPRPPPEALVGSVS